MTSARKAPGANTEPVILHAEVVQIPRRRPPVTVKPQETFDRRRWVWVAVVLGIALAAWPLGALIGSVVMK